MSDQPSPQFTIEETAVLHLALLARHGTTLDKVLSFSDMVFRKTTSCEELDMALRRFVWLGLIHAKKQRYEATPALRQLAVPSTNNDLLTQVSALTDRVNAFALDRISTDIILPDPILKSDVYNQALHRSLRNSLRSAIVCAIVTLTVLAGLLTFLWHIVFHHPR